MRSLITVLLACFYLYSRIVFADDKIKTKHLAEAAGVAVPKLYAVVEIEKKSVELFAQLKPYSDFVVGSGGEGILVIIGRNDSGYRKNNGQIMSEQGFGHHLSNNA